MFLCNLHVATSSKIVYPSVVQNDANIRLYMDFATKFVVCKSIAQPIDIQ